MAQTKEVPIANLYYLLAYAWDHFVEGDEVDIAAWHCPDIHNLLAWALSNGLRRLASRGMDKSYLSVSETTPGLRGRILVAESYRRFANRSGQMRCDFDELSADTLANQILRTTCDRLLNCDLITASIRTEVRTAQKMLGDITPVAIIGRSFERIQLHRNNRHYRFLLHICRMLFDTLLPEENTGQNRFHDILRDETRMPQLFEKFVLNFARRHCKGAKVYSERIEWHGEWNENVAEVLPTMLTDVSIEYQDRRTILDCKFYREALVTRHNRHRLHANHLYQLNAYLQNKSRIPGWEGVEGVLLYPAVEHSLDLSFNLLGHSVRIFSIDLDQQWHVIEQQLYRILGQTSEFIES